MNNLHSIRPSLTDEELSVLSYAQLHTSGNQYRFRIMNGILEYGYDDGSIDWTPAKSWNIPLTMRKWKLDGKPMPNLPQ